MYSKKIRYYSNQRPTTINWSIHREYSNKNNRNCLAHVTFAVHHESLNKDEEISHQLWHGLIDIVMDIVHRFATLSNTFNKRIQELRQEAIALYFSNSTQQLHYFSNSSSDFNCLLLEDCIYNVFRCNDNVLEFD